MTNSRNNSRQVVWAGITSLLYSGFCTTKTPPQGWRTNIIVIRFYNYQNGLRLGLSVSLQQPGEPFSTISLTSLS